MGLIFISALNFLTVAQIARAQRPKSKPVQEDASQEEAQAPETGTESSNEIKPEVSTATPTPTPPKKMTKEGILAWRRSIIEEIEKERGTKVITMIHKKELWTKRGEEPEIGIEDTVSVLLQLLHTPLDKPVDLILHTPGGYALAAQMMAMAIKFRRAKVTVMVPFYAMSGGSMMSLASDEIRMEKYSVLGPVDPQIPTPGGMWPASSLATLVKTKPINTVSDQMVILSDVANLETENAKAFVMWLLEGKMDKEQADRVASFLAEGYMSHATPITLDVARSIGLNVVEGVPEKVYELFKTFAFTGQPYKR